MEGEGNMERKDSPKGQYQDVGGATFCRSAVKIDLRSPERGVRGKGTLKELERCACVCVCDSGLKGLGKGFGRDAWGCRAKCFW